jgi:hypothetical protein
MPLNLLFAGKTFDEAKTRRIIDAFDAAVANLGTQSGPLSDPVQAPIARMTLAKRIFAMADGDMSVARLRDDALAHLKKPTIAT